MEPRKSSAGNATYYVKRSILTLAGDVDGGLGEGARGVMLDGTPPPATAAAAAAAGEA